MDDFKFRYYKCSECEKKFVTYASFKWAYRTHRGKLKLYCSYACMRKAQKRFRPTFLEREVDKWKKVWKEEGII